MTRKGGQSARVPTMPTSISLLMVGRDRAFA
jgi:hypothetical protein